MRNYLFRKKSYRRLAAALDAAGDLAARVLGCLRAGEGKESGGVSRTQPGRILLVRLDHLGDVLPATGIPKILKEHFPLARVSFLTSTLGAPLLENNPFVDEVLIYNAPWFVRGASPRREQSGFFRIVKDLRRRRFDIGLSLRGDAREHLMLALAGVKERIGYGLTGGGFLLTREISCRARAHKSEQTLDILRALGIRADGLEPRVYFSKEEEARLDGRLREWGIPPGKLVIGLQAGAGTPAKEWPASHLRAFLSLFGSAFPDWTIVLIGENRESGGVAPSSEDRFLLDLRGKSSLRELCRLLTRFRVFVGFDSGPAHLAAALGVPTVFLYSGTNEFDEWRPLQKEGTVLRHAVSCAPCGLTLCPYADHPCMAGISPESVVKSLTPFLAAAERQGP